MKRLILGILTIAICGQGSLFARGNPYYELGESPFSLDIASKAGDLVTIHVVDVMTTSDSGKVKSDKKQNQLWSLVDFIFPKLPFTYKVNNSQSAGGGGGGGSGVEGQGPGVYLKGESKWDSSSDSSSNHVVRMNIQARVIEEISKGQFLIRGQRTVIVHGKPKNLFVSGVIRKKDIAGDNSIMSDLMADSLIEVDGEPVSDLQPGWITRVIDTIFF